MACALPFRPWLSPAPRVFRTQNAQDQSTNPSLVLSCTSAPPQWLSPKLVASHRKLGRTCLLHEAPCFSPRPFSISKRENPFFRLAHARRLEGVAVPSKSPALRVWLPSRRHQSPRPRERSFSPPHSWASPFRAFFRPHGPFKISQERPAPALCYQTLRPGMNASAAFAHEASCTSCPPRFLRRWVEPLLSWAFAPSGFSFAGP
jgi:hypothetical protein